MIETPLFFLPNVKTRALTKDEIHGLVKAYGLAAKHAKEAGFDFIYIHAYTHLIDQFYLLLGIKEQMNTVES